MDVYKEVGPKRVAFSCIFRVTNDYYLRIMSSHENRNDYEKICETLERIPEARRIVRETLPLLVDRLKSFGVKKDIERKVIDLRKALREKDEKKGTSQIERADFFPDMNTTYLLRIQDLDDDSYYKLRLALEDIPGSKEIIDNCLSIMLERILDISEDQDKIKPGRDIKKIESRKIIPFPGRSKFQINGEENV